MPPRNGGNTATKEEPKRPVMSFGPYPTDRNTSIEVAVWENELQGDNGTYSVYNLSVKRSYRDEGGNWKSSGTYRPHDVPVLQHALAKAYDWIMEKKNSGNDS